MAYSVPPRVNEMSFVPAPIENSITRTLHSFARRKCPPSWGAIRIRKAAATATTLTIPLTIWVTIGLTTRDYRTDREDLGHAAAVAHIDVCLARVVGVAPALWVVMSSRCGR